MRSRRCAAPGAAVELLHVVAQVAGPVGVEEQARCARAAPGPAGRPARAPPPAARSPRPPAGSARTSPGCRCARRRPWPRRRGPGPRPPAGRGTWRPAARPASASREGPSPTTSSRARSSAASPARRCTSFSGASRPTYPTTGPPSGASRRRSASAAGASRRPGWNRAVSTPRAHRAVRGTRVLAQVGQGRAGRRQREVGLPVDPADPPPGRPVRRPPGDAAAVLQEVAGHVGLVDRDGGQAELLRRRPAHARRGRTATPGARRPGGRRAARPRSAGWAARPGTTARGRWPPGGRRYPAWLRGAGSGAMTTASWPPARSCSRTRHTLVVTPLRLGRKDSVTIAIRTAGACRAVAAPE